MRRLLAWISGAAGGFAVYRLLTRRRTVAAVPPAAEPAPDPRAEALRAKLERAEAPRPEPEPEPEPGGEPAAAEPSEDPDARRARVHEDARAAVERMRRDPGDDA